MKSKLYTFGCKVNTYDSGMIQKNLESFDEQFEMVHILNTCGVTAEATQEAVKLAKKIKQKEPSSVVVVTGCAAQVDTDSFSKLREVDLVIANSHKGNINQIISEFLETPDPQNKVFKSNIFLKKELEEGGGLEDNHTRAFLKIQDGCNSFCSYCVIPFARGRSRSVRMEEIIERINFLHSHEDIQEVVLSGVHIADYYDKNIPENSLEVLLENILKKTQMPRIRLSSLEPKEITDRLLQLYSDERMCPHFHVSVQSAHSGVLNKMRRKYNSEDVINTLELIDKKISGAFVGMDIIAGFPSESQEDFFETYRVLSQTPWTKIHVFPYSERVGTRALQIQESVPLHLRQERAQKLRELSYQRWTSEAFKQLGKTKKVLVLQPKTLKEEKGFCGYNSISRDYWSVLVEDPRNGDFSEDLLVGREYQIVISSYKEGLLKGTLRSECKS